MSLFTCLLLPLAVGSCALVRKFPTFHELVLQNPKRPYQKEYSSFDLDHVPVQVNLTLERAALTSVKETEQTISYLVLIELTWVDRRLQFDPEVLGLIDAVVPIDLIWSPKLFCFNCIQIHMEETEKANAVARTDVSCHADYGNFPYDIQFCGIIFAHGPAVTPRIVLNSNTTVDTDSVEGSTEWQMLPENTEEGEDYVWFQFKMIRNSSYYSLQHIPLVMGTTLLCLIAMTWPFQFTMQDKLNFAITCLLTLCFLMSIITPQIPKASTLPVICKWMLSQLGLCLMALFVHQPFRELKSRVRHLIGPQWMDISLCAFIVLGDIIGTYLLFNLLPERKNDQL